jgi:uncharacterized protein with von Willebrand factor type A (vWA) domain
VNGMKLTIAALLAGVMTLSPAALAAQQAQPQLSPEVQGWLAELQQIQDELEPLHQQAMGDPAIQQAQQELSTRVMNAMTRIDPEIPRKADRMTELSTRARAAQAAGNEGEVRELATEAQQLQQHLAQVQAQALSDPTLTAGLEAFQARVQGRMIEIDPSVETKLQRFEELERRLMAAMQPR